jgi:RNA polymerase sigma-70 factor (ECF subfamily)
VEAADVVLAHVPAEAEALEHAFVALYRATFRELYAFVRSQVADAATAEELVSRIYLKAYQRRQAAPPPDRQRFWLFRIASSAVIDHYRTEGRRRAATLSLDDIVEPAAAGQDPEQRLLERERLGRLLTALGELQARDRELLALKFASRHTNQEIGEVLRVSPAAVAMRLMRALRHLRRRLGGSESRS